VNSLCRLIDVFDFEIDTVGRLVAGDLARHPGYLAILVIPGVGPTLAAIFVAEIGDVGRFPSARHLCSWAGLTPRHRESDTTVHRGPITTQGSTLARWAAVEAAQQTPAWAGWLVRARAGIAERRGREHRHRRGGPHAAHPRLLRPARRAHPCPRPRPAGGVSGLGRDRVRGRRWSDPPPRGGAAVRLIDPTRSRSQHTMPT
jgi:hypothetical protein